MKHLRHISLLLILLTLLVLPDAVGADVPLLPFTTDHVIVNLSSTTSANVTVTKYNVTAPATGLRVTSSQRGGNGTRT